MSRDKSRASVGLEERVEEIARHVRESAAAESGAAAPVWSSRRKSKSLLALAAEAQRARAASGGSGGAPPGERPWIRGAFRSEGPGSPGRGLAASLVVHGAIGALALSSASFGVGSAHVLTRAAAFSAVVVELPRIEPEKRVPAHVVAPPSSKREAAAALGEIAEPVPSGKRERKGKDSVDDGRRAGVLGMLGSLDARGSRATGERGATPGPDQQSPEPFAGIATLRDYDGEGLPIGGAGGTGLGSGTDDGDGAAGGRGSGHARGVLNSFGDGNGDDVVLERRGVASGAPGGTGALGGSGEPGCRDEAAIARAVEARKGSIRRCYNSALKQNQSLAGEISVRFVIGESGSIRSAEIVGRSVADAEMEACVLGELKKLQFDESPGCDTVVRYTFHLTRSL
ncbi:MAG: AgmX/PglI C-terminal domain-containing protein [bacterium]